MHPPTPKAEHLSPESGAPMADLQPQTPKAEHLLPEKHEGMRMVGQSTERGFGGGDDLDDDTGGDVSPINKENSNTTYNIIYLNKYFE
jgi:hypothetical protein